MLPTSACWNCWTVTDLFVKEVHVYGVCRHCDGSCSSRVLLPVLCHGAVLLCCLQQKWRLASGVPSPQSKLHMRRCGTPGRIPAPNVVCVCVHHAAVHCTLCCATWSTALSYATTHHAAAHGVYMGYKSPHCTSPHFAQAKRNIPSQIQ